MVDMIRGLPTISRLCSSAGISTLTSDHSELQSLLLHDIDILINYEVSVCLPVRHCSAFAKIQNADLVTLTCGICTVHIEGKNSQDNATFCKAQQGHSFSDLLRPHNV